MTPHPAPPRARGDGPLHRLTETVATLITDGSPRVIIERGIAAFASSLGASVAEMVLVDAGGYLTTWFSWAAEPDRFAAYIERSSDFALRPQRGLLGRVALTRRVSWLPDIATETDFANAEPARAVGLHGVLAVPVTRDDTLMGIIELYWDRPIDPDTEDLDTAGIFGMLLGHLNSESGRAVLERSADQRLHRILDSGRDAFLALDGDGLITGWSLEAERMTGYLADEVRFRAATGLIVPPGLRRTHEAMLARARALTDNALLGYRLERTAQRADGTCFPVTMTLWALRRPAGVTIFVFAHESDGDIHDGIHDGDMHDVAPVAPRDSATARSGAAAVDEPTLMRRAEEMITAWIPRAADPVATPPALLHVIIDRPRRYSSDRDARLISAAARMVTARLCGALGPADAVARAGRAEFLALVAAGRDDAALTALSEYIADRLSSPFDVDGKRRSVTVTIGVATASAGGNAVSLRGDADAALNQAQLRGRGNIHRYERDTLHGGDEGRIVAELRRAQVRGELAVFYQPIVRTTERIPCGAEALLRWRHPHRGLLLPGDFIDVAESSGLISPIGAWVLEEAVRQLNAWRGRIPVPNPRVAVNLSARQLGDPDLPAQVTRALAVLNEGGPGGELHLEITESMLMADPQTAAATIDELRGLGAKIAIDDFGAGYSSLAYLKWFAVDTIKIDRSFVTGMTTNRTDRAIVRSVIDLADELGLEAVAEGVETEEQFALLAALGCRNVQGYLLGRPVSADEFICPDRSRGTTA